MTATPRLFMLVVLASLAGCHTEPTAPAASTPAASPAAAQTSPAVTSSADASAETARVFDTPLSTRDVEELRYLILKELTDRFAAANGIEVQAAEKEAYVVQVREALAKDPAFAGEQEASSPEDDAARLQIAEAFIRQWKINQCLHKRYGGRILWQQGGPEPLDAYRRFLEERESAGDFRITDASLTDAFWQYYRDDTNHSFAEPGSAEEAQAMTQAPWGESGPAWAPPASCAATSP